MHASKDNAIMLVGLNELYCNLNIIVIVSMLPCCVLPATQKHRGTKMRLVCWSWPAAGGDVLIMILSCLLTARMTCGERRFARWMPSFLRVTLSPMEAYWASASSVNTLFDLWCWDKICDLGGRRQESKMMDRSEAALLFHIPNSTVIMR